VFNRMSFENYRAFRRGSVRIAPITILVGANSIGKSSILQLPLLFKQTYDQTDFKYQAALKIHGKEVSFGNAGQVFHKQKTDKPVVFQFDFVDENLLENLKENIPSRITDLQLSLFDTISYLSRSEKVNVPNDLKNKISAFLRSHHSSKNPVIPESIIGDSIRFLQHNDKAKVELPRIFFRREYLRTSGLTPTDYELSQNLAEKLRGIRSSSFSVRYELSYVNNSGESVLRIERFSLISEKRNILNLIFKEHDELEFDTDFGDKTIPKYMKISLARTLDRSRSVFHFYSERKEKGEYLFVSLIESIISATLSSFSRQFGPNFISHIGPLRAHPKRFYFLDTAQPGSSEGELMIEALRENEELKTQVNLWLKKFDVNIDVSQFQEIIYRLTVKSGTSPIELDITDVGFGISQILPILVEGFLSPFGKTILIEQPEIHLHPKMQAEIADLVYCKYRILSRGQSREGVF